MSTMSSFQFKYTRSVEPCRYLSLNKTSTLCLKVYYLRLSSGGHGLRQRRGRERAHVAGGLERDGLVLGLRHQDVIGLGLLGAVLALLVPRQHDFHL